jgi:hypothetical protein
MINILTELEKRGHKAQLTLNDSDKSHWVSLITVMGDDWKTIKMRSQLGSDKESRGLYNSLLYSLLRNGYKLISLK